MTEVKGIAATIQIPDSTRYQMTDEELRRTLMRTWNFLYAQRRYGPRGFEGWWVMDDGGMGDWKPSCSKCFRPNGWVCRCEEFAEIETLRARVAELERVLEKADKLADELSRHKESFDCEMCRLNVTNYRYARAALKGDITHDVPRL